MYSRIAGTGSCLPEKVVSNFDLEKTMDTTDEWIRTRTGIERRHLAVDGQTTVDLAEIAARRAIEAAGVTPAEIDFIVFGTTTPDLVFPNCGTLLQARLGARGCPAFSVETACSGFIYALSIADKFVKTGESKCALVVGRARPHEHPPAFRWRLQGPPVRRGRHLQGLRHRPGHQQGGREHQDGR